MNPNKNEGNRSNPNFLSRHRRLAGLMAIGLIVLTTLAGCGPTTGSTVSPEQPAAPPVQAPSAWSIQCSTRVHVDPGDTAYNQIKSKASQACPGLSNNDIHYSFTLNGRNPNELFAGEVVTINDYTYE